MLLCVLYHDPHRELCMLSSIPLSYVHDTLGRGLLQLLRPPIVCGLNEYDSVNFFHQLVRPFVKNSFSRRGESYVQQQLRSLADREGLARARCSLPSSSF